MQLKRRSKSAAAKLLTVLLAVALVFTMMPLDRGFQASAAESGLKLQTPALLVTGQALLGEGGAYSKDNVSAEKSYSLDELKSLGNDSVVTAMYSGRKSKDPYTKSYTMATGVKISSLIGNLSDITDTVSVTATDGYAATFVKGTAYTNDGKPKNKPGLDGGRYFYDGFSAENASEVPAIIAWAFSSEEGSNQQPPEKKPAAAEEQSYLRLYVGQYGDPSGGPDDMNQPLFNGTDKYSVNSVSAGDPIEEVVLTVNGQTYTRADLLMMDFAEKSYTYQTSSGEATDSVRGVPLSVLLEGADENAKVTFETADGYDTSSYTRTVKDLVDKDYMLAYEVNGAGVYSTAKSTAPKPDGYGLLTMYGNDIKPAKMVNKVTAGESGIDFSTSPYKHITNGGISGQDGPYNIDSITGATLTIEGPGMKTSTPLSVKDLESKNKGCARETYSDTRNGKETARTYEGVDLYYILNSLKSSNIELTDNAYKVNIKNRNRKSIATLTLDQIREMHESGKPALVAYGTANEDGTNARPFVFDGGTGADQELGNEDGCLKFVYDLAAYGDQDGKYTKFANMAYIYVEEQDAPGFKHDKAPYNTAENSKYVLTVTGDEIGREINYTVDQLEDLVEYDADGNVVDNGYGYRDEYSLANSSYWYVNSYEGVRLWSLLLRSGIDKQRASDENTEVSFSATDGYTVFDKFSLKQCADPDQFGFYEKNALDNNDGTYKPNENLRQGDDVSTGDKLKVGYPVLVSYGTNEYPYVISKDLKGYLSGLSNDGGPLRVISGKWNYNHANGSNQAKLLDKIIVGENKYNYSTHSYQPEDSPYKALESSGLTVKVNAGGKDTTKEYTVKDIEELIYSGKLTKTQLGEAKIKEFYEVGKNGNFYSDLYEGINLNYFLKDVVELTGSQGSITFRDANGGELVMSLEDVLDLNNGYNSDTGLGGLSPVIAYAKNGYPLVAEKTSDGFVKSQNLINANTGEADDSYTVQNNGGPLQVVFPRADKDATATLGSLAGVTSIEIDLEADKYAHIGEDYDTYAESKLAVSGEGTRLTEAKEFTVAELEGKQSIASTKDYSFRNSKGSVSQQRYRGIDLYSFLRSTAVGLKSNASEVKIFADGSSEPAAVFSLSEINRKYSNTETGADDLPVILAYGSAAAGAADIKDGRPLVSGSTDAGYDAAYGNDGGPLKFIIGQANAEDVNKSRCIKNVTAIEVTASEQTSWNHSSAEVYKQYLQDTLEMNVVDGDNKVLKTKTYTVAEIEAMNDIISQDEIYATSSNTWEGVNFWQLIQKAFGDVEGINDPVTITVTAKDGFAVDAVEKVGLDGLKNGVKDGENYVPVLLAYAVDGYPLVYGGKGAGSATGEGYDSTIDNKGGPLRLMVHKAQGACLMETVKVNIKVGEAAPPEETADFTVTGVENGKLSVADLKKAGSDEAEYTCKGTVEKVRGVYIDDLLKSLGVTDENTTFKIDAAGYDGEKTYLDISLRDAKAQKYMVAYEVYNEGTGAWDAIDDTSKTPNSKVRIYREYMENNPDADQTKWYNKCQYITGITVAAPEKTVFDVSEGTSQPGQLPLSGIRSTAMDKDGNLWVGTYGGGAAYKAKGSDEYTVYNKASEPALNSAVVSAVCPDSTGGVWMTQNSSYTDGTLNSGVAYLKEGKLTYFREADEPATIPNDYVQEIKTDADGNVWFGSFGGLTKYDPKAGTWQTWNTADGFPAMSIDNIEIDSTGGIWCGFYPESEATDGSKPFVGGFAYFKDGKVVKAYGYESPADANTGAYRLGDVWIRDIAVDENGGAWVVASGSYGGMKNTGGRVWYVSSPGAEPIEYTGYDLFGEDAFTTDSELRMVTTDPDGGLWFGTSKDGVFHAADPTVIGGKLMITGRYSSATKSWEKAGFDNVYSLDFYGNTLYVGSNAGLATHEFKFEGGQDDPPASEDAGDATAETADLTITGDALARNGYFSIKGIKNAEGITKLDNVSFNWKNSTGTTGTSIVSGATIEDIAVNVIGLAEGAEIGSVDIVSADGKTTTYTAEQVLNEDLQGNKAMFIWTEDSAKVTKTALGQFTEGEVNKGKWAKDVVKLVINAKKDSGSVKDVIAEIEDIPEADSITLDDADRIKAAREAYEALSDAEKAKVTNLDKLTAAEKALDVIVRDAYVEKGVTAIDEIDYSQYRGARATVLSLLISRLESKLQNAKTAAEAAEIYDRIKETIASIKTEAQEIAETFRDYPLEVTASPKAYNKVYLKWEKTPKAEGYEIFRASSPSGKYSKIKVTTGTSYTDTAVKTGAKNYYKVRARAKVNDEFVYSDFSEIDLAVTSLSKPVIRTVKAGKRKATVRWKATAGASGYRIYYKKAGSAAKYKTVSAKQASKVISKLKSGKKYTFKVRAYRNVNGKKVYSKWSASKRVKIK